MRDLVGRVAVVTGAASGIGRALAGRLARDGMRVVMADVEREPLEAATAALSSGGWSVASCATDVSRVADVERLAAEVAARHGEVHLVCNVAGVSRHSGDAIWEATPEDWRWLIDVNLIGTVNVLRAFVPMLLAQGGDAHIVNTASLAGVVAGGGVYGASKHAVASLTESLCFDLRRRGSAIGVSLLCPGLVATRIVAAGRNRPEHYANPTGDGAAQRAALERFEQLHAERGTTPEHVADVLVAAIAERRFYVFVGAPNPFIATRCADIAAGCEPTPWPSLIRRP